jgi:hypothetical protein
MDAHFEIATSMDQPDQADWTRGQCTASDLIMEERRAEWSISFQAHVVGHV